MARQNLKRKFRENHSVGDTTTFQEEQPKVCQVEIEVDYFTEYTSEEDSQEDIPPKGAAGSTLGGKKSSMSATGSNQGSTNDLQKLVKEKKKKDTLRIFEKKMTQKFKTLNTS